MPSPDETLDLPDPIHFADQVHVLFVRQGSTVWAIMTCGSHTTDLGPVKVGPEGYECLLGVVAEALLERPVWTDGVYRNGTDVVVWIDRWVLTARGRVSHARYADRDAAQAAFQRRAAKR